MFSWAWKLAQSVPLKTGRSGAYLKNEKQARTKCRARSQISIREVLFIMMPKVCGVAEGLYELVFGLSDPKIRQEISSA